MTHCDYFASALTAGREGVRWQKNFWTVRMNLRFLSSLIGAVLFILPSFVLAANDLPKALVKNAPWLDGAQPHTIFRCPIVTRSGSSADHVLRLYEQRDGGDYKAAEIHALDDEPYLVVHWSSSQRHPSFVISEFAYYVRESNRKWSAHVSAQGKLVARPDILAHADRAYLAPRGLTSSDIKRCVRESGEK